MARRNRPLILLLLALISGAGAAYLALRYLRQQATPLMAAQPVKGKLVVAARPLPMGALVTEQDVKTIDWPGGDLPAGYFSTPQEVVGRGLIAPAAQNEALLEGKLAAKGAGGGLPVIIDEGMRAISLAVDQVIGVAGFVLPTNRVDVLLTLPDNASKEQSTKVIMQNVRTLAAGQSIQQDKEGKPQAVSVVTLLVTPEQAETLSLASSQGRIQLALRNNLDTVLIKTTGTRVSALLGTVAPVRVRRRTATATAAPEVSPTVVEVYRGGARTLQKF
jgi:pilus assembly protein CpaB